ncbi:MAG: cytochrome c oxidase subunit II [Paracoccaceae bacterium]
MRFGMFRAMAGAAAALVAGQASARGIGFQSAATELAGDLQWLDGFMLLIMTAIVILVTGLLIYVIRNFSAEKNATPARFTHNSLIEVLWTAVPVLILVVIAIPSLQLLDEQVNVPEADMTIKATGNQWFWTYEYPDEEMVFDAYMIGYGFSSYDAAMADPDMAEEMEEYGVTRENWLLQTDTAVVVPIGKVVRMQVTASDVIHSWTVPAFGVKMDGIPGRLNETWFKVEEPGIYYGQCSELCGKDHAYMPITVRAVPQEEYDAWLEEAIETYAGRPASITVAAAE